LGPDQSPTIRATEEYLSSVFMMRTLSIIVIDAMMLRVMPGNRKTPSGRGMHGRPAKDVIEDE
jgi:hypothetical protein